MRGGFRRERKGRGRKGEVGREEGRESKRMVEGGRAGVGRKEREKFVTKPAVGSGVLKMTVRKKS